MQIEGLAGIVECLGQSIAAGDDVRQIGEVHGVSGIFRLVRDRKDVAPVLMRRLHDSVLPGVLNIGGMASLAPPCGLTMVSTRPSGR